MSTNWFLVAGFLSLVSGFRSLVPGPRDAGYSMLDAGYYILDAGYWIKLAQGSLSKIRRVPFLNPKSEIPNPKSKQSHIPNRKDPKSEIANRVLLSKMKMVIIHFPYSNHRSGHT